MTGYFRYSKGQNERKHPAYYEKQNFKNKGYLRRIQNYINANKYKYKYK